MGDLFDDVLTEVDRLAPAPSGERMYERIIEIDERLAKQRNWPKISSWWRAELKAFYASGKRRFVGRVGRRGGKSTTLQKVVVAEVLYGDHPVPSGDVGYALIVAVKLGVAKKRLQGVKLILDALQVEHEPCEDGVRIRGTNRAIIALAASYRTSVGDTVLCLFCDEVARWRDEETGSNPATEVLRTLRPAMLTMPNAREFLLSSPFSTMDAHAEAFDEGNTLKQQVACAPTWVATNGFLTEQQCREEEPDEETFWREYGAKPMRASASAFLDPSAIDAAVTRLVDFERRPGDLLAAGGDFAFARNSSALAVVRMRPIALPDDSGMRAYERVAMALRVQRPTDGPLKPSEVVDGFASELEAWGVRGLMADAHYRESIVEHLARRELSFIRAPLDPVESYIRFRVELHQSRVSIPRSAASPGEVDRLARDLKDVRSRPTPNGRVVVDLPHRRDGSHADLVSALVLASWQRGGTEASEAREAAEFEGWSDEDVEEFHASLRDARRAASEEDADDDTGFGGEGFLVG